MNVKPSYTGHSRRKSTPWTIRAIDLLARTVITLAGVGTIVAVLLICGFLVGVVVPLFLGATVSAPDNPPLEMVRPVRMGMDEYRMLGWSLQKDGKLSSIRLDQGQILQTIRPKKLYDSSPLVACAQVDRGNQVVLGFEDGTIQLGRIGFQSRLLTATEITDAMAGLKDGENITCENRASEFSLGLAQKSGPGIYRLQSILLELENPIPASLPAPLLALNISGSGGGSFFLAGVSGDGTLSTRSIESKEDFLTGEKKTEVTGGKLRLSDWDRRGKPSWVHVMGKGEYALLIWENGHCLRVATRPIQNPQIIEEKKLLEADGSTKITATDMLLGRGTLITGDSLGRIRCWFRAPESGYSRETGTTSDNHVLVPAHTFAGDGNAVTQLATSTLSRSVAVGNADGRVKLLFVPSEKQMAELRTLNGNAIENLLIAPKDNQIIAFTRGQMWSWQLQMGHPEITFSSLILPQWYEGYPRPAHVWQPAGGSDESEGKFGMWPIVFGTLKATFYSLLLGVPLAYLAAIYTSEFMHRKTRAVVKPIIEMMASLPSVILGFLAALVVAPFVNHFLSTVLAGFLTIPGSFLLGAYLWQLLPQRWTLFLDRWRLLYLLVSLVLGIYLAPWVGTILENLIFHGDLRSWLNDPVRKNGTPGWFLLLLPFAFFVSLFVTSRILDAPLRGVTRFLSPFFTAILDLGRFVGICLFSAILALGIASLLTLCGLDPRDSLMGVYDQQNALVVGFMMGFAIIPIVYTISEDALSLVPEHLRSASLGCGATPWQTATRIIIPAAMSGLFSALMIGLGRAVGETMIVLMAAGGTAILDLNLFNGFRTLSATIATELPDTVKEGTHYRTLFLAALTLFIITFLLNTIAELVRIRFRKRVYQL